MTGISNDQPVASGAAWGRVSQGGMRSARLGTVSPVSTSRMLLVLACAAHVTAFVWIYESYVSPTFSYLGFTLTPMSFARYWMSFLLATLPGVWMPLHLRRPSQFIHWIIYLLVYVPSIFVPTYMALQPTAALSSLQATLFLGFGVIGLSGKIPRIGIRGIRLSKPVFWVGLAAIGLACTAYVYSIYRGNFKLVSFANVYQEIRFSGSDLAEGTMVNYAIMLLGGVLNPFLMLYAIVRRLWPLYVIGALGQLMLYATAGQKVYAVSIVLLPVIAFVLRKNRARAFGIHLTLLIALGCFLLNGVRQVTADEEGRSPWNNAASLAFMRTLAMPGMLTGLYHDFFSSHPRTHYSHVRGVSSFVSYPYEKDIGRTIGFEYLGDPNLNANAHFWAVDGLAAWGLPGILTSSLFCCLVFWLIDCAAAGRDWRLGTLLCVLPTMMLANTSLFTTLMSGGLAFCIMMLFCMPVDHPRKFT